MSEAQGAAMHGTQLEGRERVRFVDAVCEAAGPHRARARTTLSWEDAQFVGEAAAPPGLNVELRIVAEATIRALQALTSDALGVRLVGIKRIRAFDAELIVVGVSAPGGRPRTLVGAVVVGTDPHRAAALAVLHAVNRVLGNHLSTS